MDFLKPFIIAHRGASKEAPENTLPAFERAIALNADGIEFDVLLTQDRVPIITHNDDLSILTQCRGYVHATPFATVRSLDVGRHFGFASSGTTVPTLVEALELIQSHNILTIIEIKPQPGMIASSAELIGKIASSFHMKGPIIISSSSLSILRKLRHRYPSIHRALIIRQRAFLFFASTLLANLCSFSGIHASLSALTPSMVRKVHKRGNKVFAWTANEPDEFDRCLALKVDGIITNDVAGAKRHIKN